MKTILLIALLVLFFAGVGFASDSDFKKIDKNNDGRISKQEYIEAAVKSFAIIDQDQSGFLTSRELQAIDQNEATKFMKKEDINKDGKISREEFTQAAEKRFKFMDKNNNGLINQQEWNDIKSGISPKTFKTPPVSPLFILTF